MDFLLPVCELMLFPVFSLDNVSGHSFSDLYWAIGDWSPGKLNLSVSLTSHLDLYESFVETVKTCSFNRYLYPGSASIGVYRN